MRAAMRLAHLALIAILSAPSLAMAQAACPEPCAEGEECGPDGTCAPIAGDAQGMEALPMQEEPPPAECFPACRDGFVCSAGQCVEACNPPCGIGFACSAAGACEAVPGAPGATADPGYSISGGVVGIIMAALSLGLYVTVAAGDINYWVEVGLGWGAVGLPFITAPIVGGGALSASGVEGLLPLRIAAWILYGAYAIGSIATAIYAADHSGAIPFEAMVTLAVGGLTTELAFVVDAFYTGAQANAAQSAAALPTVSLATSSGSVDGAVLGLVGRF